MVDQNTIPIQKDRGGRSHQRSTRDAARYDIGRDSCQSFAGAGILDVFAAWVGVEILSVTQQRRKKMLCQISAAFFRNSNLFQACSFDDVECGVDEIGEIGAARMRIGM